MYDKDFAKRIDLAVKKIGGIGKASSLIGVSLPTITRWKEGVSDPKVSNMVAFANAAEVKLDWLLNGEDTPDNIPAPVEHKASTNADADKYAYIPLRNHIQASAGGGYINENNNDVVHLAFRKDWLTSKGLKAKDLEAITAKGDSMKPTIPDSSIILIDHSKTNALDGRIYVVRIDDQLYVKRIQWLPTGLRLISDNKNIYAPIDLTKSDLESSNVQVYGQVVHISYDLPH